MTERPMPMKDVTEEDPDRKAAESLVLAIFPIKVLQFRATIEATESVTREIAKRFEQHRVLGRRQGIEEAIEKMQFLADESRRVGAHSSRFYYTAVRELEALL